MFLYIYIFIGTCTKNKPHITVHAHTYKTYQTRCVMGTYEW